ncbi:MAG: glycosyltransferase family 4 protein [Acidimicrobiia bacterium]
MSDPARSARNADELVVSLVTRGSPAQVSGGHLYHRRMAEAAPARRAAVEFISVAGVGNPLRAARGVVVVDSITAWSVAPWLVLRRRRHAPIAAMLHQPPGGVGQGRVRTALQRPLDRAFYRRCDLLIVASTSLRHDLVRQHGLPAERICVVEPGSDLPAGRSPSQDLRRGRRIAILCVGNWLPNKGVLELLDAVAQLPPDHATLHLAGRDDVDADYAARVRARAGAPDLAERVVIHGAVTRGEVADLYAAADVFALASYAEAYGTVYGEALAAGLPAVGWRAGNLPNLVEDGREGCVLPPGDVAGLAAALRRLATDDEWRTVLTDGARRRGQQLPTWSDAADAFFAALRRLANGTVDNISDSVSDSESESDGDVRP